MRIRGGRSYGRLAQRRDVADGNETAVRGQMTSANDGTCAASRPPTDRCTPARRRRELHRQRSKFELQVSNSRPPDGLTRTANPAASRWNIADSPGVQNAIY